MAETIYVSLKDNAETLWPHSLIPQPSLEVLEKIWLEPLRIVLEPTPKLQTAVLLTQNIEIAMPGLEQVSIVLGAEGENTTFILEVELEPVLLGRLSTPLTVRLRNTLLRPVERVRDNVTGRDSFQIDHEAEFLELSIANAVVTLDHDGNISLASDVSISLPLCSVGDTGLILQASNISFDLNSESPVIAFSEAEILLPDYLPLPPSTRITMSDARINAGGFTGKVSLDLNLSYDEGNREFVYLTDDPANPSAPATIYGDISGGLRHVSIAVEQSVLTAFDLVGSIIVPYFDEPVDVRITFTSGGSFTVALLSDSSEGITLTKEELLALSIKSLALSNNAPDVSTVVISGGVEPLLMSGDGLEWPRLDVTDLSIDSNGKFRIREAWLDLKELATLDLWGFHFELRRIGIGSEQRNDPDGDRLWIDLSGGLRLIEQIPVALDVEGFRLTWPQNLLEGLPGPPGITDIQAAVSKIEVEFDGIYLFFGVPDAIEFEGLIRFFKDEQIVGFAGDMALRVPASGFGAEAGLLIGLSFDPPFPFLYVYFGVELPAGIPLGQSGLALKGALGMFGLNVAPDKTPEQNWYYDWYKRGPIVGAHPTNKWRPERNALALGVGVTITTADGYVKGTRGLIVLSIPGPILIIEGRALILSGLQPDAEPPLRALAVFDGGAGTVQFNIEAEATLIADLLKAYGMLEAFFDFNDLTNWHLYLGQDTPNDRRIRASILKLSDSFLFKADAYLMIDMVGAETLRSRIGVSIGFEPNVPDIDPLKVDFDATLSGDGLVTVRPEQFSGEVDLSANIRLSALGVSVRLSADARFLTEGPKPLKVGAHVRIRADMPAPLDPVEATVEFEWEAREVPPVVSPLSEIAVSSRFIPDGGGFDKDATDLAHKILNFSSIGEDWEALATESPVVPVDSRPIVGFTQKMNSSIESFARHPDGNTHHYDVGLFHFEPSLTTIDLYEHLKSDADWTGDPWTPIASTDPDQRKPLPGVWLAESEPESPEAPSPRRVQFWTDNPLSSSARALGAGYIQFRGAIQQGTPLAERLIADYPDLMQCTRTKAESVCVDFASAGDVVIEPGESWAYEDLRFQSTSRTAAVRSEADGAVLGATGLAGRLAALLRGASSLADMLFRRAAPDSCLFVDGYIDIQFRRRVKKVRIVFCQPSKLSAVDIRVRLTTKRGIRSVGELDVTRQAQKSITLNDLEGCNVNVAADLTVSDDEWLLEADEGFDCLHIVRMDKFAIREICYTTVDEVERSRRAIEECKHNSDLPTDGQTLRPGAYYRLDVRTNVRGELHLEDLPFSRHSAIGEMLVAAYNQLSDALTGGEGQLNKEFHQTCFFQTEAPPTKLRPYIKWCSPQHQSERFFYDDSIAIRFLRGDMRRMFQRPFNLMIQIRDARNVLVEGYKVKWQKAKSATLFPEESSWEAHRSTLGWPEHALQMDDVLIAEPVSISSNLLPQSRYQLELVTFGPDDKLELSFSSTFVTSKFQSFKALAESYSDSTTSITAKEQYQQALSLIADCQRSARVLAHARWEFEHAEVDFRFESLAGGRKGMEQSKLTRRDAVAAHDANIRALADGLADLFFAPVSATLEIYLILDKTAGTVVCAWLRSPESLDLRYEVLSDPDSQQSDRIDSVGRTEISLQTQVATSSTNPIITLATADGTQLLVFPSPGRSWRRGKYALVLTHHRDYGDELATRNHRYDRPIEYGRGNIEAEQYLLKWHVR